MRMRPSAACAALALGLLAACSPPSRHAALEFFFDGVPPYVEPPPEPPAGSTAATALVPLRDPSRRRFREHGPYGARLCTSCHEKAASNTYVVPKEKLCAQCHELDLDREYLHGPVASGGCTECHDPHSSNHRYLLVAEPKTFCFRCHEKDEVAALAVHEEPLDPCTSCHDPHASDDPMLMR